MSIKYCSDLIKELEKYIEEYGDDRVIIEMDYYPKYLGNDSISKLVQIPDDDLDDNGFFCYIVPTRNNNQYDDW